MAEKLKKTKSPKIKLGIQIFGYLAILILVGAVSFYAYYWNKIYPGVKVAGIDVSQLTVDETAKYLNQQVPIAPDITIVHKSETGEQKYTIPTADFKASYDYSKSAQSAYRVGRSGNIFLDGKNIFLSLIKGTNTGLAVILDEQELANHLAAVSGGVSIEPVFPSVEIVGKEVKVNKGKSGQELDLIKTRLDIGTNLTFNTNQPIVLETKIVDPTLSPQEEKSFFDRATKLQDKNLNLTIEYETFTFSTNSLLSFLSPKGGYATNTLSSEVGKIAQKVNRPPQEAAFQFTDGKVVEFTPAKQGLKLQVDPTVELFTKALEELENTDTKSVTKELLVEKTSPQVETSEVNNLGIKELIGRGTSSFRGSISSRIHNVALATSRVNGHLIQPGEVFSFNAALGDVSKLTGYKEAYVIQNGKTVLGDGGGVCQVSTTMFRAAMNAGLPIEERRAHSYRVGYYEQDAGPGLDATVFAPTTDLKIKNDTPAHILIQAKADTKNLTVTFELYGTSDGRVSEVSKPKILSQTAPPADVYQDDPTLAAGTIKQVEHRAWGAKTIFNYTVKRQGQEIYKKDFLSVYKPWAAVYLRGTAI